MDCKSFPDLSEKWKKWSCNTELRTVLDIKNLIHMMDGLAEESEDINWQELWKMYEIPTRAEPECI